MNTPRPSTEGEPSKSPARWLVTGLLAALLAITPLLPLGLGLAVLGLVKTRNARESRMTTWTRVVCTAALVIGVVMIPLYLMFLDEAGLFRMKRT